ncbi:hypothetical protein Tco_1163918 [Tanacetum coccineum]
MPRECLKIIESKSKVRQTRAKAVVAKVSTNSSTQAVSSDVAELKDIVRALPLATFLPVAELFLTPEVDKRTDDSYPANNEAPKTSNLLMFKFSHRNPNLSPILPPVVAYPVQILNPQFLLPYPSRRDNEKSRNQANEQIDKFYEIFKEMSFEISFTDALVLMPKFFRLDSKKPYLE